MSTHTKKFVDKTVPDSIPRTTTKGPLLWGRRFDAPHKFQCATKFHARISTIQMQQQQGKIDYAASCTTLIEWQATSKYVGTATSVLQLTFKQG